MSYEIVYGTNFIDLGNGKYLPVILTGSNNCTMFYGNKEIRERSWCLFFGAKGITTKENMLEWAKNIIANHTVEYEMEWFKKGGKWVVGEQIYKYIENACKNAHTIEEYVKNCCQPIQLSLYGYDKENHFKKECYKSCNTTEDILKWFEESEQFDMGNYSKNYLAEFWGIKPFGIKKSNDKALNNSFLVKVGNRYLVTYSMSPKSYTVSKDKSQAKVFTDKNEFEINIIPLVSSMSDKSITAVSSELKTVVKPFCIKIVEGSYQGNYIGRFNARSVRISSIENSRKFRTEKEAQSKIDTVLKCSFPHNKYCVVNCLA